MNKIFFVICVLTAQLCTAAYLGQFSNFEEHQHDEGLYLQHHSSCAKKDSKMCFSHHILKEPKFWDVFSHEVQDKKSWKCAFPADIIKNNIIEDALLYDDDTIFYKRRQGVAEWIGNDTMWSTIVLGACKELAEKTHGEFVQKLENLHLLEALADFVDHINYFYEVASIMRSRGEEVLVLSPDASPIHDIDKLDPIMLVGYSERFEDNRNTSLWLACLDRHTCKNPHHQAHCMWRDCCRCGTAATNNTKVCMGCDNVRSIALREMVCDKVSRRLQKNLDGEVSENMWDTDMNFYEGLSAQWIDKASALLKHLKYWNHARSNLKF